MINALVIANLEAIFSQALPPQIALAAISAVQDVNGDGFPDVVALIALRTTQGNGNSGIQLFQVTFDGLSTSGGLIGGPVMLGTF